MHMGDIGVHDAYAFLAAPHFLKCVLRVDSFPTASVAEPAGFDQLNGCRKIESC